MLHRHTIQWLAIKLGKVISCIVAELCELGVCYVPRNESREVVRRGVKSISHLRLCWSDCLGEVLRYWTPLFEPKKRVEPLINVNGR